MKKKGGLIVLVSVALFLGSCGTEQGTKELGWSKEKTTATTVVKEETKMKETLVQKIGEKQKEGRLHRTNLEDYQVYVDETTRLLELPEGYVLKEVQTDIQQNGEDVIRLRYGLDNQAVNLFGEHFSVVYKTEDKMLLGVMAINKEAEITNDSQLPRADEVTALTKEILERLAPGYFEELTNLWIDRHDEPFIRAGEKRIVSGTKYKAFAPQDNQYAWVVVDQHRRLMNFERGINWTSGRTTEKWLYDAYLEDGSLDLFAVRRK